MKWQRVETKFHEGIMVAVIRGEETILTCWKIDNNKYKDIQFEKQEFLNSNKTRLKAVNVLMEVS